MQMFLVYSTNNSSSISKVLFVAVNEIFAIT